MANYDYETVFITKKLRFFMQFNAFLLERKSKKKMLTYIEHYYYYKIRFSCCGSKVQPIVVLSNLRKNHMHKSMKNLFTVQFQIKLQQPVSSFLSYLPIGRHIGRLSPKPWLPTHGL